MLIHKGAMFDSHPVEGETPSAKGSMFVLFAEDIEQVKQFLRQDVYSTSGVWDWEKATITPVCLILFSSGLLWGCAYDFVVQVRCPGRDVSCHSFKLDIHMPVYR